jgi:hypothetical protein
MSTITEAAQRVAAAAQEQRDRHAAGEAEIAQIARERAIATAQQDTAREEAEREFDELKAAAREAFGVASDAIGRITMSKSFALRSLADFDQEHGARRDVAEAALGRLLTRVDDTVRAEAVRFVAGCLTPQRCGRLLQPTRCAWPVSRCGPVNVPTKRPTCCAGCLPCTSSRR